MTTITIATGYDSAIYIPIIQWKWFTLISGFVIVFVAMTTVYLPFCRGAAEMCGWLKGLSDLLLCGRYMSYLLKMHTC